MLTPPNILKVMLSEESIRLMQRGLRKATGVLVSPEDIVRAVRHLLNEAASAQMNSIKISLPERRQQTKRVAASRGRPKKSTTSQPAEEAVPVLSALQQTEDEA